MEYKKYKGTARIGVKYTGGVAFAESKEQAEEDLCTKLLISLAGPTGPCGDFRGMVIDELVFDVEEAEE